MLCCSLSYCTDLAFVYFFGLFIWQAVCNKNHLLRGVLLSLQGVLLRLPGVLQTIQGVHNYKRSDFSKTPAINLQGLLINFILLGILHNYILPVLNYGWIWGSIVGVGASLSWILRKSSALDFGTKTSDFILSEGSCRAFFARLHILVTVRQCAIIGNKQFELRSSGVV